ncbi:acyltransferase family protein [Streptomyces sp. NBC_00237]|uniref:lysophospholipid acyltransferase family protein n=1 Tax=Streptomyces sp. NBC_00237 TaxID=2975687 RepID=UPI00225006C3|nr:lysophospholipid acyltransferase family protein [Streptomyces sp. NBC_00237]MCX5205218.1 acyltransferase family protein [Streptomyces sp. NBC_00237]
MQESVGEISDNALRGLTSWLADSYFRVETSGIENVPESGPVILVANHSGAWALDGFILNEVLDRELERQVDIMASSLVFRFPVLASTARKAGIFDNDPTVGLSRLESGKAVGLFPEGFAGVRKPFRQRYRLRTFSTGFAVTAMRAGAPVVPVSIVGAEEAYPKLGEVDFLARLTGLPYFPVTTLLPLPSKWLISFGEPIPVPVRSDSFAERAAAARLLCDEAQATVQKMVDRDRARRASPFH